MSSLWRLALLLQVVCGFCSHLASGAVLHNGAVIPAYATVCTRNDPQLNSCLRDSLQTLIQKISREGIRQLNLGPLDPWYIDEMTTAFGNGDPFKVSMTLRESNTYGFSRLKFHQVRAELEDPKRITLEVDFTNDKVYIEGRYEAEGLISDFPILGRGTFNMSMSDLSGTFRMKGHLVEREEEQYLQVDRATMRPDVGNLTVSMTNEHTKYPELTNLFVGMMNQFWKAVYQELLPFAEEAFDAVLRPAINMATLKIPYDQLIPPK